MFKTQPKGEDWAEPSARLIDTIAELLDTMSVESESMQASIGAALDDEDGAVTALMRLQRLDFHTQKQADLASVLRALATNVRAGRYDRSEIESAANLHDLRDALRREPKPATKRKFSVGRADWFD